MFAFLKSTFSEPDGTGSTSRVLAGATVFSVLAWISYIVLRTHGIPDLTQPSLFITSSYVGYGLNKAAIVLKSTDKAPEVK